MPAAIDADLFGATAPEPVSVAVTGLATTDRVAVYREVAGERRALVRGATGLATPSGALVVLDVEAPFGRAVVYVAEVTPTSGAVYSVTAAPVVVTDPGRHVFSDPFTGRGVFADVVATTDERSTPLRASVLYPAGRARPVALVDARQDDTGELVVHTRNAVETAALRALLDDGMPVVSREAPGRDLPGSEVLLLTDVNRSRRTTAGDRLWTLTFVVVDSPDLQTVVVLTDLGDLATYYTGETLQDLATDYPAPATLLDLARADLGTA